MPAVFTPNPTPEWVYYATAAALLGVVGGVLIGVMVRRRRRPALGDVSCPLDDYLELAQTAPSQLNPEMARGAYRYQPLLASAAGFFGLPVSLMMAVAHTESGFDPTAGSSAGAYGLMQIMPKTAIGVFRKLAADQQWPFGPLKDGTNADPQIEQLEQAGVARYLDRSRPEQSAWLAAALLRSMGQTRDLEHTLAAYNAGVGRVQADTPRSQWPAQTRQYVPRVLERADFWEDYFQRCARRG